MRNEHCLQDGCPTTNKRHYSQRRTFFIVELASVGEYKHVWFITTVKRPMHTLTCRDG